MITNCFIIVFLLFTVAMTIESNFKAESIITAIYSDGERSVTKIVMQNIEQGFRSDFYPKTNFTIVYFLNNTRYMLIHDYCLFAKIRWQPYQILGKKTGERIISFIPQKIIFKLPAYCL